MTSTNFPPQVTKHSLRSTGPPRESANLNPGGVRVELLKRCGHAMGLEAVDLSIILTAQSDESLILNAHDAWHDVHEGRRRQERMIPLQDLWGFVIGELIMFII